MTRLFQDMKGVVGPRRRPERSKTPAAACTRSAAEAIHLELLFQRLVSG